MASTLETCANAAARPGSPSAGDTVYQIDTKQVIVYDGSVWRVYDPNSSSPYDLDGTNSTTATPLFHFDASFVNGSDATGNPANAASFTGQWTSRVNGKTTVAQGTASAQPTFYTSGENSKPYLSFDGGDFLDLTEREYCGSSLTVLVVGKGASNAGFNPIAVDGSDVECGSTSFVLGCEGVFYGYSTSGVLLFFNQSAQGYPGVTTHAAGKDYNSETRSVIYRKNSSAGASYIDGDNAGSAGTTANPNDCRFGRIGQTAIKMTGFIYEIVLFNSYLSDADLNSWGAYVTAKYAAGTGAMEAQDSF